MSIAVWATSSEREIELTIEYITIIGHGGLANRIATLCEEPGYLVHLASAGGEHQLHSTPRSSRVAHPIERADLVVYAGYGRESGLEPLSLASSMMPRVGEAMRSGAILAVAGDVETMMQNLRWAVRPEQMAGLYFPSTLSLGHEIRVHLHEHTAPGVHAALSAFVRRLHAGPSPSLQGQVA